MKFLLIFFAFNVYVGTYAQANYSEDIEKVSQRIQSIRIKRDWIKNDPVEDSIAVSQGWYEKMRLQLAALTDKKRNLIKEETGKRWVSIEEFETVMDKKKTVLLADENYIIEQN